MIPINATGSPAASQQTMTLHRSQPLMIPLDPLRRAESAEVLWKVDALL